MFIILLRATKQNIRVILSALFLQESVVEPISHIKSDGPILPSYFQALHEVHMGDSTTASFVQV
jgi:hypothetical protein